MYTIIYYLKKEHIAVYQAHQIEMFITVLPPKNTKPKNL